MTDKKVALAGPSGWDAVDLEGTDYKSPREGECSRGHSEGTVPDRVTNCPGVPGTEGFPGPLDFQC